MTLLKALNYILQKGEFWSPSVAQWVKDPALSLLQPGSLLWHEFQSLPQELPHAMGMEKKKKKKKEKSSYTSDSVYKIRSSCCGLVD